MQGWLRVAAARGGPGGLSAPVDACGYTESQEEEEEEELCP
jgi:hypothetical protein